jgi:putative endonuclease
VPNLRRVGADAEDRAASALIAKGYTILKRRYTAAGGEIDLIAMKNDVLVFVEVRFRSTRGAEPEASVTERKRERLFRAARSYLASWEGPEVAVRYDLVAIDPDGLRHHEEAFRPYG